MSDPISRQAAIDALIEWYGCEPSDLDYFKEILAQLPSADRPQGEWILKDEVFYCSCCGNDSAGLSEDDVYVYDVPLPNYCQDCGARMFAKDTNVPNKKGVDDEVL